MKKIVQLLSMLLCFTAFLSCSKTTDETLTPVYATPISGKNRFTVQVDGVEREYYVHVPKSYTGTSPVPVVFMLHGTGGDGLDMWERSGWREVGEDENVITVYPSSWRYCIITQGETKNTTKWNTTPDSEFVICAGQTPRNDIKFLTTVITEITARYKIDSKRVYLAGFSNGGNMAAKCAVELSDKLAAVCENAASFYLDTTYIPKRKLPVLFQVGNEDYGPGNTGPAIPLSLLDTLIRTPGIPLLNGKHYRIAQTHIKSFGLNPNFTISGDTNSVSYATYRSLTPGSINDFRFVMVKNLRHAYPNGDNHWMEGARVHWAWFKQYSMP